MGQINSYKDLIVWQKSFAFAKLVYKLTARFPQSEVYGMTSQICRAAVSIPSNIAEGFGRGSTKERLQFFQIAFGSSSEVETQPLLAKELGFGNVSEYDQLEQLLIEVRKMLNSLLASRKPVPITKS